MRKREGHCKECGKFYASSRSGYCNRHSPLKGKYERTKKHKEKMSQILKGKPKPWFKGKKRPEHSKKLKKFWGENPEMREKARQRGLRLASDKAYLERLSELLSGENNPNWCGGLAQKKYKKFYQKLKNKIRKRDEFACQLCKATEESLGYTLSIHHIDFDKGNSEEENLVSLCKQCNSLVNFGREKWTKYFQERIVSMSGIGSKKASIESVKSVV